MAESRESLRNWHRLFGLLLTDFFSDSPFVVEVERDLSVQQQLLEVVVARRRPGPFRGRLPDGDAQPYVGIPWMTLWAARIFFTTAS
jgi:hypothetical protein